MKIALFVVLMVVVFPAAAQVSISPQQQKAIADFAAKMRAQAEAQAKKDCFDIAVKHPLKSPATAKEEQAAVYAGCMAGRGFSLR